MILYPIMHQGTYSFHSEYEVVNKAGASHKIFDDEEQPENHLNISINKSDIGVVPAFRFACMSMCPSALLVVHSEVFIPPPKS